MGRWSSKVCWSKGRRSRDEYFVAGGATHTTYVIRSMTTGAKMECSRLTQPAKNLEMTSKQLQ